MKATDIQSLVFEKIAQQFTKRSLVIPEIAKVLHMSDDSVYRRIRNETALTTQELANLALHFSISLDALIFQQTDTVFSSYSAFSRPIKSFQEFVEGVLQQLQFVHSLPGPYLYYASQEIPVFHYMYFPELIQFKLYVWGLTTWNFEYLKNQLFHFEIVPYPVIQTLDKILPLYNTLPGTELWSLNIVDNTLNQIEYVANINQFKNPDDALLLCDKILELVAHMREMAKVGKKFLPGVTMPLPSAAEFNLYHNELMYTSNTMLITTEQYKFLVTVFCNPNFLRSTDQKLCDYTFHWMENIISNSNAMSIHSRRNRKWYFNRLEEKVQHVRERIAQLLKQDL